MKVILIVDSYGVNDEEAVLVTVPKEIHEIRTKIINALSSDSDEVLRIKLKSNLYKRIRDYEGLPGLEVKHIYPKVQLARILGENVPEWLTEKIIVDFHLLASEPLGEDDENNNSITRRVLYLVDPGLNKLSSFEHFYRIVENAHSTFGDLLRVDDVYNVILYELNKLEKTNAAKLLLDELVNTKSPSLTLIQIGRDQILERIRRFAHEHNCSSISFPPRHFSSRLLTEIPMYQISEKDAGDVPLKLCQVLDYIDAEVRNSDFSAHHLAEIVVSWPTFIQRLSLLLEENTKLASNALAESLSKFEQKNVVVLSKRVAELLRLSKCDPVRPADSVDDVVGWSRGYLDYARHCFLQGKEPDELISGSFTRWLLEEEIRVQRSDKNWRYVSHTIESNLKNDNLVVVCMVDALGAIHLDLLKTELDKNLVGMRINDKLLFSPIPTLTEVCKMSVITGQERHLLSSSSQEALIRNRFMEFLTLPDSLSIAKSWKDFRSALTSNTKMLVCIENRIDERLHGCVNYRKHVKDVGQIVRSLVKDIHEWLIYGAQLKKEVIVIITADHGVTSISRKVDCGVEGVKNIGERVCRVDRKPVPMPQDTCFVNENPKSINGYVVPTNRCRYSGSTPLVHGGLTVEEVMIPFVVLKKGENVGKYEPLELLVDQEDCQIVNGGWQVQLILLSNEAIVENIKISVSPPFSGIEGPIGPINPHKRISLHFMLKSSIDQSGLLNVTFTVTFSANRDVGNRRINVTLPLRFPSSILDTSEGAKDFDEMFN